MPDAYQVQLATDSVDTTKASFGVVPLTFSGLDGTNRILSSLDFIRAYLEKFVLGRGVDDSPHPGLSVPLTMLLAIHCDHGSVSPRALLSHLIFHALMNSWCTSVSSIHVLPSQLAPWKL